MKVVGQMHSEDILFERKGERDSVCMSIYSDAPVFSVSFMAAPKEFVSWDFVLDGYMSYARVKDCVVACIQDSNNLKELEDRLQENFCEHFCDIRICDEADDEEEGTVMLQ